MPPTRPIPRRTNSQWTGTEPLRQPGPAARVPALDAARNRAPRPPGQLPPAAGARRRPALPRDRVAPAEVARQRRGPSRPTALPQPRPRLVRRRPTSRIGAGVGAGGQFRVPGERALGRARPRAQVPIEVAAKSDSSLGRGRRIADGGAGRTRPKEQDGAGQWLQLQLQLGAELADRGRQLQLQLPVWRRSHRDWAPRASAPRPNERLAAADRRREATGLVRT